MWTEYLNRIGLKKKDISIDESSLIKLHKQHVLTIPFEDLNIHARIPIILETDSLFNKIISNNRGGFCYELNYLFYSLLKALGFEARIISSRIYNDQEILGPEFDHMSIIVTLNGEWLLDVGYGDLFIHPIKIVDQKISKDWFKSYRIDSIEKDIFLLSESKNGSDFTKRYQFSTRPRKADDFNQQCQLKQESPDSYFVKNLICTLPKSNGRCTIFNDRFIEKKNGIRKENLIQGGTELVSILKREFNIEFEPPIQY